MAEAWLTTSWDDGHPLDLRLADMLARHGIGATFYVPANNCEGRPVLDGAGLTQLAQGGFEIGAHTHDHVRLHRLDPASLRDQIGRGKDHLEQILGLRIDGFCYPGGRGVARARPVVAELGFTHARTVEMFRLDAGTDPLARPTSLLIHPLRSSQLLRNWARQGGGGARLGLCLTLAGQAGLEARLDRLIERTLAGGGLLHLWAHSWEIDAAGLWPLLERVLARLAQAFAADHRLCNAHAYARARHHGQTR